MNTLHLKYVLEIEKAGSITRAADNLFMGQPNLSKAIKELEESLGITIFRRTSKGVIATEKGEKLIQYARKILSQVEELELLSDLAASDKHRLNICIPRSSYAAEAFVRFAGRIDRKNSIELNVQETSALQAIDCVADGDCKLAVIRYQTEYENYFLDYLKDKNIVFDPVWTYDYVLLFSKRSPLARFTEITACDLVKFLEIAYGDDSVPYIRHCQRKDCETGKMKQRKINVYDRQMQFELLSQLRESYMWSTPVNSHLADRYHLVQKQCCRGKGLQTKDVLVYGKNYQFSELDKLYLVELFTAKRELEQQAEAYENL